MNKADFLITGVMKGGTTILYDFITYHPQVNKATYKEIHYFSLFYDKGDEWYSEHFKNNGLLNGEASPTYFDLATTATIPNMITRHNQNAKVIVILRDPVERAISHYNHLVKINGMTNLEDMGPERFFNLPYSKAILSHNDVYSQLYYVLNFSCYAQKLNIYKQKFKQNLLVLDNNSLRSDPYKTMSNVYAFLGVDDTFKSEEFEKVKYSAGTSLDQLSKETVHKLYEFFEEDIALCKEFIKEFE